MGKITVGIADGHQLMREAIVFVLKEDSRFSVVIESGNGQEAIEAARKVKPDIMMLLEIMMNPMNGFVTAQLIQIVSPETKIIGLSVHTDQHYVRRLMESGAKGYITKSSSKEEIIKGLLEVYNGNIYLSADIKDAYH